MGEVFQRKGCGSKDEIMTSKIVDVVFILLSVALLIILGKILIRVLEPLTGIQPEMILFISVLAFVFMLAATLYAFLRK